MGWHANPDLTLARESGVPFDGIAIRDALDALAAQGEDAVNVAQHLRDGAETGLIPVSTLVALGRLCHGDHGSRDAARSASHALFRMVLPTPVEGGDTDFFWRVARALRRADDESSSRTRNMAFRTFIDPRDAAAFATRLDERLFTLTEGSTPAGSNYTVWYWE